MIHTRDSKIIISWPCSALATPFRFWIFPYLSSLFFCSWKMSKKGIILNIYFNEHFEIEPFSFNFFVVVVRVRSKYFLFYCILWNVHLFISPTFFNHQGEIFFFSRIHLTLLHSITCNLCLIYIVYCFLKLLSLFFFITGISPICIPSHLSFLTVIVKTRKDT